MSKQNVATAKIKTLSCITNLNVFVSGLGRRKTYRRHVNWV